MTPSNSMLTWSVGAIAAFVNSVHVATSPDLLQVPTCVLLLVTSTTDVFPRALVMSVPVGNVTVMLLTPWRERPRSEERRVGKECRVRAPAAADGDEIVTDGWVTWWPATML